jgi:hypothetical protein
VEKERGKFSSTNCERSIRKHILSSFPFTPRQRKLCFPTKNEILCAALSRFLKEKLCLKIETGAKRGTAEEKNINGENSAQESASGGVVEKRANLASRTGERKFRVN